MRGSRLDHAPFGPQAAAGIRFAHQAERGEPRNLSRTRHDRVDLLSELLAKAA
jgi:hypothetical protein